MDTNVVSNTCTFNNGSGRSDYGSLGFSGGSIQPVPEPGTVLLFGLSAALLAVGLGLRGRNPRLRGRGYFQL